MPAARRNDVQERVKRASTSLKLKAIFNFVISEGLRTLSNKIFRQLEWLRTLRALAAPNAQSFSSES